MRRHSASGTAVVDRDGARPIKDFLEALEEFEMIVSLHGRGSAEVDLARANVRRLRDLAAEAWRAKRTAEAA